MSISRQRRPLPQTQEVTIHKFAFSFVKMKVIIQSKGPPEYPSASLAAIGP